MATKEIKDTKAGRSNTKQIMDKSRSSLSLSSVPAEVKGQIVSTKPATKQRRISSAGEDDHSEMENIKCTLTSIQETLKKQVTKDDIKDLVKSAIVEVKEELKKEMKDELKEEIKEEIKEEMLQELKTEMSQDLEENKNHHGQELSKMRKQLSDKVDSLMMDNDTNMDNVSQLKNKIATLEKQMKEINGIASTAISMANMNQQYSMKNNIKIMNWPERKGQKLKEELCALVAEKGGVTLDPRDILAIHRIPTNDKNYPRPVIVKFISSEVRRSVIVKREQLKEDFKMLDHITNMNAQLLRKLRAEERQHFVDSAWYYNGHVYVLDLEGNQHRMDVTDDIDKKLLGR